jgi:hypothetical protein
MTKDQVLTLWKQGYSKNEIAKEINSTSREVRSHLAWSGLKPDELDGKWRRQVIHRLLEEPQSNKKSFYAMQMKFLAILVKKYPNRDFWKKINFSEKYQSLKYFDYEPQATILAQRYAEFNYQNPKKPKVTILLEKHTEDTYSKTKTNKTVKDFFNT